LDSTCPLVARGQPIVASSPMIASAAMSSSNVKPRAIVALLPVNVLALHNMQWVYLGRPRIAQISRINAASDDVLHSQILI
jgi:hypothetical protein